jgi:hypothetical protein
MREVLTDAVLEQIGKCAKDVRHAGSFYHEVRVRLAMHNPQQPVIILYRSADPKSMTSKELYAIYGWYRYDKQATRIPQHGYFVLDLEESVIVHGFIHDARWGGADIEGELKPRRFRKDLLSFTKHYGDGSDNVAYELAGAKGQWKGTWKAEQHNGAARLWTVKMATDEFFSYDKAKLEELRPRKFL